MRFPLFFSILHDFAPPFLFFSRQRWCHTQQLCDHIHDGLGFLTQHLGLSMRFEEALQAVQPMSALPYWDFTIDSHMVASGAWSMLDESPLWTAKWFGATNEADGAIKDGRWARAQVPRGAAIQNSCEMPPPPTILISPTLTIDLTQHVSSPRSALSFCSSPLFFVQFPTVSSDPLHILLPTSLQWLFLIYRFCCCWLKIRWLPSSSME